MSAVLASNGFLGELENVYKSFGSKTAVEGLNLTVSAGELIALLGPNGAGKTTTIAMMLGLQQPDAGSVRLFGQSPQHIEARRGIGVMLQQEALPAELRVGELLESVTAYYPDPYTPEEVMQLTNTSALGKRAYGKLSGGQKRLVQFALAICGRPKLIFLDEPTTGLDIEAREMLWTTIRALVARGTAVVLTTHYLEEAEALADRVVMLVDGRAVACGTVQEMRSVVTRKRVSCATSLDVEEIRVWPGVEEVQLDGAGRVHLTVNDSEDFVRRLLIADPHARDVEIHRAGLNEAFRQLTRVTTQ